jgi:hypothetical protein
VVVVCGDNSYCASRDPEDCAYGNDQRDGGDDAAEFRDFEGVEGVLVVRIDRCAKERYGADREGCYERWACDQRHCR